MLPKLANTVVTHIKLFLVFLCKIVSPILSVQYIGEQRYLSPWRGVGCMRAGLILHFQLRHRLNNSLSGKESSFYQLFGAFGPTPQFQNAVYVLSRTGSNIWCAIVGILDCPFNSNINPPTAFQVKRALPTNSLGPWGQHPNSKTLPIIQDWANCTSDIRD